MYSSPNEAGSIKSISMNMPGVSKHTHLNDRLYQSWATMQTVMKRLEALQQVQHASKQKGIVGCRLEIKFAKDRLWWVQYNRSVGSRDIEADTRVILYPDLNP
jgi:hypothetical protein